MKPSITLIGAGAVGTSLALALRKQSYTIRTIVSRTESSAEALARRVRCTHALAVDGLRLPPDGMVFITAPDDALPDIVARLCRARESKSTATVVHTSGALSGDFLGPLRQFGAAVGSFHPLMLFPRGSSTGREFMHCPVAIEGDDRAVRAARTIARALAAKPFSIPAEKKTLYHIAAVFASNYFVTLLSAVERTGAALNIPREEIIALFQPLIRQTLDAVIRTSPKAALTGPIARNDRDTIRRHLDALRDLGDEQTLSLYIELGLAAARLAKEKNES